MGQIMKSLASVCRPVTPSVKTPTAAILIRFWQNFLQLRRSSVLHSYGPTS